MAPDKVICTCLIGGIFCPVTNMFDVDGDETDDEKMAVSVVVQLPNGMWTSLTTSENLFQELQ